MLIFIPVEQSGMGDAILKPCLTFEEATQVRGVEAIEEWNTDEREKVARWVNSANRG